MSKYLRPDSASKMMRYRASLVKARYHVSVSGKKKHELYGSKTYSSLRDRRIRKPFMNHAKNRPYALNIQFKIRFFGYLHHIVSHGPDLPAKRFKQAHLRWESIYPRKRKVSYKVYDRRRAYM